MALLNTVIITMMFQTAIGGTAEYRGHADVSDSDRGGLPDHGRVLQCVQHGGRHPFPLFL